MSPWRWPVPVLLVIAGSLAAGCAGSPAGLDRPVVHFADGPAAYVGFDLNRDGRVDYVQKLLEGRKVLFLREAPGTDRLELMADRSPGTRPGRRHLWVLMQGVPYDLMEAMWQAGRFRLFYRPGMVIAPLEVRPDAGLMEVMGAPPAASTQPGGTTQPHRGWGRSVAYRRPGTLPWGFDLKPRPLLSEALSAAMASGRHWQVIWLGDVAGPARNRNRDAIREWLEELDLALEQLTLDTAADVEITLVSTGGNDLTESKAVRLPGVEGPARPMGCLVVPADPPAGKAHGLAAVPGVDLIAYRDGEAVVVLGPRGRAAIRRQDHRLAYEPVAGDPLELAATLADLKILGQADKHGFASEKTWRDATREHRYPDPLWRLWRAVEQAEAAGPAVVVCLDRGYHVGGPPRAFGLSGSLAAERSRGFILSTAFESPGFLRADQVLAYMRAFLDPLPGAAATAPAPTSRPSRWRLE